MKLNDYAKGIAAIAGAGVTTALTIWGPETQVGHILIIVSAMLTAVTVYAVRNGPADSKPSGDSVNGQKN